MDYVAVFVFGVSLVSIFYGAGGLWIRSRAPGVDHVRLVEIAEEQANVAPRWDRTNANAVVTSLRRPWWLLIGGLVGVLASVVTFVIALGS